MSLPSSGAISMSQVNSVFGVTNIGGMLGKSASISGYPIRMGQFYGLSSGTTQALVFFASDGRFWKNSGGTVKLNSGTGAKIWLYTGGDVYNAGAGRVAFFLDNNSGLAVRHTGFVMYYHGFTANNFDWAWYFRASGTGVQIYNDYGGGYWVTYDGTNDNVWIQGIPQSSSVTWYIFPGNNFNIIHPDGRTWKNSGGTCRLNSGSTMSIYMGFQTDVYGYPNRFALLQDNNTGAAIRHTGFVMYPQAYAAGNFDFAWTFIPTGSGVRIYNDYSGGYYVGYDSATDAILICPSGDSRIVTWNVSPRLNSSYVH